MIRLLLLVVFSSIFLVAHEIVGQVHKVEFDKQKAYIGKILFSDVRFSKDNTIACESCHRLDMYGVDGNQYSHGVGGAVGDINSPTVFNSAFNFVQFWDGRAKNLYEQALGPITNPKEMNSSLDEVMQKISADQKIVKLFNGSYKNGLTKENLIDSIVQFEKALVTLNSPFDKYLMGNKDAISNSAKDGFRLFKERGCISCHNGDNFGGNMFQKFGIFSKSTNARKVDYGRYNVTHNEKDRFIFKVPSLRNVAKTAPYFHNGQAKTLEEAVTFMVKAQLGQDFTKAEIRSIVVFLNTLTGETPEILKTK